MENIAKTRIRKIQIAGKSSTLYGQFTLKVPFKDFIRSICTIRNDAWSVSVRFRVDTSVSDLHAADTRYHQDCKTKFLHSKYVDQIASQITTGDSKIDIGLESVKKKLAMR